MLVRYCSCGTPVQKFDAIIGLKYLSGMHLNDSKTEFGSRKDRHENIGMYVCPDLFLVIGLWSAVLYVPS